MLPYYCATEAAFVNGCVNWYVQIYGANRVQHTLDRRGDYVAPFSEITAGGTTEHPLGQMQHNNRRNGAQMPVPVTVYTPGNGRRSARGSRRFTTFECRKGFYAKSGAHPNYNLLAVYEMSATDLRADRRRQDDHHAAAAERPVHRSRKPTRPKATLLSGDRRQGAVRDRLPPRQARSAARITRWARSNERSALAPRWVHSYSDRISGQSEWSTFRSSMPTTVAVSTSSCDRGRLRGFLSEGGINKVIDVQSNGTLTLTDQAGLIRRFDATGRLVRIDRGGSEWSIDLRMPTTGSRPRRTRRAAHSSSNTRTAASRRYGCPTVPRCRTATMPTEICSRHSSRTDSRGIITTTRPACRDAGDRHALTGISNNSERFATYAYDAANRARLTQHHANGAVVDKIELAYAHERRRERDRQQGRGAHLCDRRAGRYRRAMEITHTDGTETNTFNDAVPVQQTDKLGVVTRDEFTDGYEKRTLRGLRHAAGTPGSSTTRATPHIASTSRTVSAKSVRRSFRSRARCSLTTRAISSRHALRRRSVRTRLP